MKLNTQGIGWIVSDGDNLEARFRIVLCFVFVDVVRYVYITDVTFLKLTYIYMYAEKLGN